MTMPIYLWEQALLLPQLWLWRSTIGRKTGINGAWAQDDKGPDGGCGVYGQNQNSFSGASEMLKRALHVEINKEAMREVTEGIGRTVYEADTQKAGYIMENMHEAAI